MPDEDGTLSSGGHNELLVGGDGDLRDGAGVTNTLVVLDSFIVVPDLDDLVLSSRDVVLSFVEDGKGVDLTSAGSIEHADGLTIEAIPVGNLAVGTGGKNLRFIGVVKHGLEHGGLEEAHDAGVGLDVPDNARAIVRGGHGVGVGLVDLNIGDSASVFLEGGLHDLSLSSDSPDSDFSFHSSGDDVVAVVGGGEGGDSVVVGVVDSVEKLSGLGEEGTDLTVVPSRDNALTVSHERGAVALKSGDLNTEELLAGSGVPDTDVVDRAGREELRVPSGERDVINAFVMASVSELGCNIVGVAPVDGGLVGSGEAVSGVGGKGDGGDSAHDLGLTLDEHVLASQLGNGTVTSSNHNIIVVKELDGVNSLGEESLGWANSLEEAFVERDLNNISSACSEEGVHVGGVNGDASVVTLDLAHVDVLVENLLGDEVDVPEAESVVVDSDELVVSVVEELNLVSNVHSDVMSDKGFAALDVPDDELVIVLATEGGHVALVSREGQVLDEDLVQLESVEHGHRVEVPDDNVGLESHVGLLSGGDVLAGVGDGDHADVIIVSSEELLGSREGVSNHEGGAEGEDNVLVIGMEDESTVNLALESDDSG